VGLYDVSVGYRQFSCTCDEIDGHFEKERKMRKSLVLTLTGADRVGLVDDISKLLLEYDGNVESSRMARLGGEFAVLMMVTAPEDKFEVMREAVRALRDEGFKVTTRETQRGASQKFSGWLPYRVTVYGADHEGIIHNISHYMAEQGINIESMETGMTPAPWSGTMLFTMNAIVLAPPHLSGTEWREDLAEVGDKLNVDIEVTSYTG
jgi:glycine cleavage system transcriptional repressor